MTRKIILPLFAIALACGRDAKVPDTARATPADGPVVLRNGPNAIDLLGDGTPAQVFVAWRGNYNAHGFSTVAVYLRARSDLSDTTAEWQIVPRFGGPHVGVAGREIFTTAEGADCTLGDLRIVQHRGGSAELIIARRDFGDSFADSAAIHFDYYKVGRNTDESPGAPPYFFQFVRTVEAQRPYCDVNLAFERELGLGRAGLGHGEASE